MTEDLSRRSRLGRLSPRVERAARRVVSRMATSGAVTLGPDVRISPGANLWSAHGLEIGGWSAIGRRNTIHADGRIGCFAMLGTDVRIVGRIDHDMRQVGVPAVESTWVGDRDQRPGDVITIGDDVWIGAGATILTGLSIGDCAVVAAGAVVVSDVPAFAVVAGNPATVIGERFAGAQAKQHLDAVRELIEIRTAALGEQRQR